MKVLIIGAVNSTNLGDRAIYFTLKNLFESQEHEVSGLDLTGGTPFRMTANRISEISLDKLFIDEENFRPVAKREDKGFLKSKLISVISVMPTSVHRCLNLYLNAKRCLKCKRKWETMINNQDLVIFGGGAILKEGSWGFPLALLRMSRLVKKLGVTYGCLGCSVGEDFGLICKRWFKEFLNGSSFIFLRDPISGVHLQKLGAFQYEVYVDSAICTKELIKVRRGTSKGIIGINILPYLRHPEITKRSYHRYIEVMKNLIIRITEMPQLGFKQVILFNNGNFTDTYASQALYSQIRRKSAKPNIKVCNRIQTLEELCYVICQCDVVIGTRLHASIISKSCGVPIIGIAWSKKVTGFYEMLNLKEFCFDYRTCSVEAIIGAIENIESNNFSQKSDVEEQIKRLKELPKYAAQKADIKE